MKEAVRVEREPTPREFASRLCRRGIVLIVGLFDAGAEIQLLDQRSNLGLGQNHDCQLSKTTIGFVCLQDVIIGELKVVEILKSPVLKSINGVMLPIFVINVS